MAEDKAFARIEELDALVKEFASSKKEAAEKLIADVTKKVRWWYKCRVQAGIDRLFDSFVATASNATHMQWKSGA